MFITLHMLATVGNELSECGAPLFTLYQSLQQQERCGDVKA